MSNASNEKKIWDFLYAKIGNAYGVAGLMGNLYAESGLRSNNLQNSYEKKLGLVDDIYTKAVDNGTYTNFVNDRAGYGLAQWTNEARKEGLLKYAKSKKASIGDVDMQLGYLYKELSESYKTVLNTLKKATSIQTASDIVLTKFERPANQGDSVKAKRAKYGKQYFDKYATTKEPDKKTETSVKPSTSSTTTTKRKVDYAKKKDKTLAGSYKVTAAGALHIRAGAGTTKLSLGTLPRGAVVNNYGYYSTASNGAKWLYVDAGDGLIGFCSAKYLKKC